MDNVIRDFISRKIVKFNYSQFCVITKSTYPCIPFRWSHDLGGGHIYRGLLSTTWVISVTSPWFTLLLFRRVLFTLFHRQHFVRITRVYVFWFFFTLAPVDPHMGPPRFLETHVPVSLSPGPRATIHIDSSCVHQYNCCQAPRRPTTMER